MYRFVLAGLGLAALAAGTLSAGAHTTDKWHPHPHSMDFFAAEGVVTVLLMIVAGGLLVIARRLITSRQRQSRTARGRR